MQTKELVGGHSAPLWVYMKAQENRQRGYDWDYDYEPLFSTYLLSSLSLYVEFKTFTVEVLRLPV